ncbi:MAG: gluconokinase [Spirochaetales bacterium]|nr:gluconokinase [Spirochaetales bacterium]
MVILIMGVSGCGKTTVGELTAQALGWPYLEADSFHPEENLRKMSGGTPLTDEDRWPWLEAIRQKIAAFQRRGESAVFTCSALKESYRQFLGEGLGKPIEWVYLKGSYETIRERMASRKGHYFKSDMLKSQFDALEEPDYGLILSIDDSPEQLSRAIVNHLKSPKEGYSS